MANRCSICNINLGMFENYGTDSIPLCFTCSQTQGAHVQKNALRTQHTSYGSKHRPVVITFLLFVAIYIMQWIPYPGINFSNIYQYLGNNITSISKRLSPFGLGTTPYIFAVSILMFFSGFVPFLKKLFSKSYRQETSLNFLTFLLTALLAGIQATGISLFISSIYSPEDGTPLIIGGRNIFMAGYIFSTIIGTLIITWLLQSISKMGFINGISIVFGSSFLIDNILTCFKYQSMFATIFIIDIILMCFLTVYIAGMTVFSLQKKVFTLIPQKTSESSEVKPTVSLPFRMNASGILPLFTTLSLSKFIDSIPGFSTIPGLSMIIQIILTAFVTFLCTINHYDPKKIIKTLNLFGYKILEIPEIDTASFLERQIKKTILPSILVNCSLFFMSYSFTHFFNNKSPFVIFFEPYFMIVIVTFLEIGSKIKAWVNFHKMYHNQNLSTTVCIYSADNQLEADIINSILRRNSIPSLVQNTYAVSISGTSALYEICSPAHPNLTVYGPMGKGSIKVVVPKEMSASAEELIRNHALTLQTETTSEIATNKHNV